MWQALEKALRRVFGEKAEGAQVDPENRGAAEGAAGHRQQRSVAAEDHHQVDEAGKIFPFHFAATVEDLTGLAVDDGLEAEAVEFLEQFPTEFAGLAAGCLEDHADPPHFGVQFLFSHRRPF